MNLLNIQRTSRGFAAILILTALAIFSSGCALPGRGGVHSKPMDPDEIAALTEAGQQDADSPTVTVSIKSQFGKKKTVKLPLEYGMTLQNVLVETKVTRRFRDMDIKVIRVTPQSKGKRVPLQAEYDPAKNGVGILHDMTLYPGDHIEVVENNSTAFDDAVSRFTGKR